MNSRSVDGLQRRSGSKSNKVSVSKSQAAMLRRANSQAPQKVSKSTIISVRKTDTTPVVADASRIASVRRSSREELEEHKQQQIQKKAELAKAQQLAEERKLARRRQQQQEQIEYSEQVMNERLNAVTLAPSSQEHRELGVIDQPKKKKGLLKRKKNAENLGLEREDVEHGSKEAREFLADMRDVDATDFDEVPAKEKRKSWNKQQRQAKKAARHDAGRYKQKKRRKWPWVLLVILLVLGTAGYFGYNYVNEQFKKMTGDDSSILGLLFADDKTPLQADGKGRTNILIFGTEGYSMDGDDYDGGLLTDSMMMVSLNQDTGDIKAISLPRDLHYQKDSCTGTAKLNEVFYCHYSQNDGSAESIKKYETEGEEALASAFEDILGVEIQYKVHVNWAALLQVVDALGGIDVVFLYGDQTWDGPETTIEVSDERGLCEMNGNTVYFAHPTQQVIHLNGTDALGVARARNGHGGYGAISGNFSREYFQQRIISALVQKARSTNFVTDLGAATGLLNAVGDNIRSTFKDTDIKTLMRLAKEINIDNMETLSTIENYDGEAALMTTGMENGISYVLPVGMTYDRIHNFIQKHLYADGAAAEDAKIVVLNGTEVAGLASSNKQDIEDEGLTVDSVGDAPDDLKEQDGVFIYQNREDLPETIKKLQAIYPNATVSSDAPESLSDYAEDDIIVIIGNGYAAN